MENNGESETRKKTPEKQLTPEYIAQKAPELMRTAHNLFNLLGTGDAGISKRKAYQWKMNNINGGSSDFFPEDQILEITEDAAKEDVRRIITLGPKKIAATYMDFKNGKQELYINTERALNEAKRVMSRLSINIDPKKI